MKDGLGHRERVLRAVERRDIDRVPFFFRADRAVSDTLKKRYGLSDDLELISHFQADAIQVAVPYRKERFRQADEDTFFYDMFGSKYKRVEHRDMSSEAVVEPVLAGAECPADIDNFSWPGKGIVDLDRGIPQAQAARDTGLAVYGGVWASIFTHSRYMLGEEKYLVSLAAEPELISRLVERVTDCFLELNQAYLEACGRYLDIYYFGSDFGTQDSMFISPEMFRRFFKPHLRRIADQARGYGLKVMFHTCGAVAGIIPDLIECGIDILDPVQASAAGMGPAALAEKFKGRIAFHGGISTQTTLPLKSPPEVRQEVLETVEALGPLGYVAAPDQDLMGDIPVGNIEVMFETLRNYRL